MKIGIIGGGSIGLLLGSYLSEKNEVTIYVRREEQMRSINNHGLSMSESPETINVKAEMIDHLSKEDCLFICVKQNNVEDVIGQIKRTNNHTPLFFLQNGMGHIDILKELNQAVYVGVVEHGAYRDNDYSVIHTGKGNIKIAEFHGDPHELKSYLQKLSMPHFPITYQNDWRELLVKKLIVNAVINPLTALFNVKNGEILTNKYITYLARELCLEASRILNLNFSTEWEHVQLIAQNTAENTSSMLADLNRMTKTENDAISGYLVNHSKDHSPYTSFIYNSIKALEEKQGID